MTSIKITSRNSFVTASKPENRSKNDWILIKILKIFTNYIHMKQKSSSIFESLTICLFNKIIAKFCQNILLREEKLLASQTFDAIEMYKKSSSPANCRFLLWNLIKKREHFWQIGATIAEKLLSVLGELLPYRNECLLFELLKS